MRWREASKRSSASVGAGAPFRGVAVAQAGRAREQNQACRAQAAHAWIWAIAIARRCRMSPRSRRLLSARALVRAAVRRHSAAKWTEHGRSGTHWVVSAYHVDCGLAEAWARRLTHAKLYDQGAFKTNPVFAKGTQFPAHFDCETHRTFNAHPYSEGVCVHLPETSNDPNFAWGIQH